MYIPGDANAYKLIGMAVGAGLYFVALDFFYVRPKARKYAEEWMEAFRNRYPFKENVDETNQNPERQLETYPTYPSE